MIIGCWMTWALFVPVSPAGQNFVLLRPGYSTMRIAAELKSAKVIRSEYSFVIWHYFHRKHSLKAGEYLFESPANEIDVHKRLVRGDIYVYTVVIPEGYTMFDIANAIQESGLGSRDEFLKIAQSETALVSDLAPEAHSLEGYLFPNTYQFTRTQSMQEMVSAMVKQFRQIAQQIGLTNDVQKTVTMASIIEKETGIPDERPLVASVYYNRLANHIALDADPSVIYAELLNGNYQGALHHADMRIDSPYNTYRHPGLPPGPIGNPGKSSLEAAMHPAQTDYYYFVSDGNGRHRFAHSLEEHNRNVAAYRRAMRGQ
ncbi:MAG: endolytic transglycosylase MltG [Acidobacteria bacterium]|nr:MAG: endolytic transglycosylase MltG [Acidobacteriota bacterium]